MFILGFNTRLYGMVGRYIGERTHSHLRRLGGKTVSSKPIVMRAQFAYCPNLTIIDTPGFILKAKQTDDPDTPEAGGRRLSAHVDHIRSTDLRA